MGWVCYVLSLSPVSVCSSQLSRTERQAWQSYQREKLVWVNKETSPKGVEGRRHNKLGRELSSRSWRQWEKTKPRLADLCHEHELMVALFRQRD